jgi:hypothetical protein
MAVRCGTAVAILSRNDVGSKSTHASRARNFFNCWPPCLVIRQQPLVGIHTGCSILADRRRQCERHLRPLRSLTLAAWVIFRAGSCPGSESGLFVNPDPRDWVKRQRGWGASGGKGRRSRLARRSLLRNGERYTLLALVANPSAPYGYTTTAKNSRSRLSVVTRGSRKLATFWKAP